MTIATMLARAIHTEPGRVRVVAMGRCVEIDFTRRHVAIRSNAGGVRLDDVREHDLDYRGWPREQGRVCSFNGRVGGLRIRAWTDAATEAKRTAFLATCA